MKKSFGILFALCSALTACSYAQTQNTATSEEPQNYSGQTPHLQKQGTATQLIVGGKPFLMIAGELHNSTCGGTEYMRPIWTRLGGKNLNTVVGTVSWELIEPAEGKFNFSIVDSEIIGAREADLKLILIWFASWKNGSSVYIPSFVKEDYKKYPRAKDEYGKPLEILSVFGSASCEADAHAFAALMHHIKQVDGMQQTVVMVQVENEVGVIDNLGKAPGNARRDFSPAADAAYTGTVPKQLMDYLVEHKNNLFPRLYEVWAANGFKTSGSWEKVFGKSEYKPDKKDWNFFSLLYRRAFYGMELRQVR